MPIAADAPATARDLLAALAGFGPTVIGGGLTFAAAPPPDLVAALRVLHTGVRAVLTGRRWFGIDARGRGVGPGRDGALDPAARLPAGTVLVTVEGDPRWDRLPAGAAVTHPDLFAPPADIPRGPALKLTRHRGRPLPETGGGPAPG